MHRLIDRYIHFQDRTLYKYGKHAMAISAVLLAFLFIFLWYLSTRLWTSTPMPGNLETAPAGGIVRSISDNFLECDEGKSIRVQFAAKEAHMDLSDGREISLPQAQDGSIDRYSNSDESFLFFTNNQISFVAENGKVTYANCAAKQN